MTQKPGKLEELLSTYVETDKLAGAVAAIVTDNGVIHSTVQGYLDRDTKVPMAWNSIFRIYSMTKPITSIATMMMWEEGVFDLDDPVSKYLPSYSDTRVLGTDGTIEPAQVQMSIRHVLTHTAGITLPAFSEDHLVPLYLEQDIDGMRSKGTLTDTIDRLGKLPVKFEPGSQWAYSMSTDILGRLVEVWSGLPFDVFLKRRIFDPLNMNETAFQADIKTKDRLTTNYSIEDGRLGPAIDLGDSSSYLAPPEFASGSGGLVSTADDYLRFMRMLLNGGSLDGTRILNEGTLTLMTKNHLSGDMDDLGAGDFNESYWGGIGFGLGFNVVLDPEKADYPGPAGEYGWTGAAGTVFFVNPELKMAAILLTQYMPSYSYPLRKEFRAAIYDDFSRL
jgi:CubicO group peptidase (beta-lactamase class C family)